MSSKLVCILFLILHKTHYITVHHLKTLKGNGDCFEPTSGVRMVDMLILSVERNDTESLELDMRFES